MPPSASFPLPSRVKEVRARRMKGRVKVRVRLRPGKGRMESQERRCRVSQMAATMIPPVRRCPC
jgi:hypothetical protein